MDDDTLIGSVFEILGDMLSHLIMAAIMAGLVTLSFSIANQLGMLEWFHVAASIPVLVGVAIMPLIMSPALLGSFGRGLKRMR